MKIAVSACLLGENLRYDGGHKRESFIVDELGKYMEFVSFCPEHIAYGTPRPSVRLVSEKDGLHVRTNADNEDRTDALIKSSNAELEVLKDENICGMIFKARSPSCGLFSTKLYLQNGQPQGKSDGVFASMCRDEFELLALEDEGRLQDAWLRENFVMQIFAYDAFERFKSDANMAKLVDFHQRYKFMLQSKDENLYRNLGRIVGNHEKKEFNEVLAEYEVSFKRAIAKKSSIKKTRNVIEHMSGFVKKFIDSEEKSVLHEQIEDYANKIVPLIVPLSTLKLYAQKYNVEYLKSQAFLNPYPKELALRSDIKAGK